MCTHGRVLRNKYTGRNIFLGCGDCPSCQMERSARSFRKLLIHKDAKISGEGRFCLFVTLNYDNDSVPYIHFNDIVKSEGMIEFDILRNKRLKCKPRVNEYYFVPEVDVLQHVSVYRPIDLKRFYDTDFSKLNCPVKFKGRGDEIAVCSSRDFDTFIKRFRNQFSRLTNYKLTNDNFSYYKVSEYGPGTFRPHFHVLFFFPFSWSSMYDKIKRALVKAWPFCSLSQIERNIQVAEKAEDYVSKYTVKPTDYPPFFRIKTIAAKASTSNGFGFYGTFFTPAFVENCINRETLEYPIKRTSKEGVTSYINVRIPKYITNRYFPPLAGISSLSDAEVSYVLASPSSLYSYAYKLPVAYSSIERTVSALYRAKALFGHHSVLYPYLYQKFRYLRQRDALRMFYENYQSSCPWENYDIVEMYPSSLHYLYGFDDHLFRPNEYHFRLVQEQNDKLIYKDLVKKRKQNEYMSTVNLKYIVRPLNVKKKWQTKEFCKVLPPMHGLEDRDTICHDVFSLPLPAVNYCPY